MTDVSAIQRYGVTPRWSDKVVHAGTVYLVEVAATPGAPFEVQVGEIFSSIEHHLEEAGSGKDRLLMVTIYLTDMAMLGLFNGLWEAWLPEKCAPARACVRADLAAPGYAVELVVTAAVRSA